MRRGGWGGDGTTGESAQSASWLCAGSLHAEGRERDAGVQPAGLPRRKEDGRKGERNHYSFEPISNDEVPSASKLLRPTVDDDLNHFVAQS